MGEFLVSVFVLLFIGGLLAIAASLYSAGKRTGSRQGYAAGRRAAVRSTLILTLSVTAPAHAGGVIASAAGGVAEAARRVGWKAEAGALFSDTADQVATGASLVETAAVGTAVATGSGAVIMKTAAAAGVGGLVYWLVSD